MAKYVKLGGSLKGKREVIKVKVQSRCLLCSPVQLSTPSARSYSLINPF